MCHRWWRRGERAPGTRQIGYQWAYIFSAVRPDTGDDVTLVMPSVNAKVMDLFLAHFADTLDQDAHAVMMCDGAGWHDERALSQFTGFDFTGVLKNAGVRISMDGRGRCMDNIFIERLWRSLKYEAVYLHELTDGFAAERVIGEWIDFYNTERPH